MMKTPDGKFMGSVKVGSKGQIVIPKEVRDMFNIETGETLILLADINQGIAIQKFATYETFAKEIFLR
ncbi:AbrB/MazE/SpoVT family DNA-binding domain-containing protein [endosymbiont 'TC1' of Trimyema compressum]|uniref:AbrB/MazE/SpoVT family DNA-binding domain-containing protein n=1 Tax=endosymbiont 'TC1' of Trimyema compressum TaxID=243899 RepID=UPI000B0D4182|nr:AbrB/MazE/SpoVT family DNA-binding domain-containing protein [endosymbiont 'TC1' of Trimyema compressum]